MVSVVPFQPLRYDASKEGELGAVIAPPYDQISPEMQETLYNRHPNNFVRLIFGKIFPSDNGKENRYTRAASCLQEWQSQGILKHEDEKALFVYEQSFTLPGRGEFTRRGFTGLMGLAPLGQGVLPHEQTFSKPKEDRLSLMRACRANFEHVFFLYDDPGGEVEALLAESAKSEPLLSCKDEAGTRHVIWRCSPGASAAIPEFFRKKELLIADGHHRYETSLTYQKEMRQAHPSAGESPFDFRLGTFVSLQDKGLVILPTHRVVSRLPDGAMASLQNALSRYFHLHDASSLKAVMEKMAGEKHAFGIFAGGKYLALKLKEGFNFSREFPNDSAVLRDLDVFLLHKLLLERLVSLPSDRLDEVVRYVRWPEDACRLVETGEGSAAFFLNPAAPHQVKAVAAAGEKMPHKSTDFYPKLWSGLLFYKMQF